MRSLKLPEPFTYFVDRCLGGEILPNALRESGFNIEVHHDHFKDDTADAAWLAVVGERQWVVLTKDKAIRSNELERNALVSAKVALFALASSGLPAAQMAHAFIRARTRIEKALRVHGAPLIATVNASGGVQLFQNARRSFQPPKPIK